MSINVLLFGSLAEIAGCFKMELENIHDLNELKLIMEEKISGLNKKDYVIAINGELVMENTTIENGNEIAFLPPFAGG